VHVTEKKAASGETLDVPCAPLGKGAPLEKPTEYLCGEATAPKLESKSTVCAREYSTTEADELIMR